MKKNLFNVGACLLALGLAFGLGSCAKHQHNWSSNYSTSETSHWKTCDGCSDINEQADHTFGEPVVVEATTENAGSSTVTCNVCGYEKVTQIDKINGGTKEAPLTTDAAIEVLKTLSANQIAGSVFYVKGVVTGQVTESNRTAGTYRFDLIDSTDDTYKMMNYFALNAEGVNAVIKTGDTVVLGGTITVYTKNGNTIYEFTETGLVYDVKTCAHPEDLVKTDAANAQCGIAGNTEYYTCSVCGRYYADALGTTEIAKDSWIIKALDHELTHHEAVPSTCVLNGTSEYWSCSLCNCSFADAECKNQIDTPNGDLPLAAHTLVKVDAVAAQCEVAGNIEYYECSVCGAKFADAEGKNALADGAEVVAALGHQSLTHHDAVNPTLTTNGNVEYWTCDKCEEYFLDKDAKDKTTETGIVLTLEAAQVISVSDLDNTKTMLTLNNFNYKFTFTQPNKSTSFAFKWMINHNDTDDSRMRIHALFCGNNIWADAYACWFVTNGNCIMVNTGSGYETVSDLSYKTIGLHDIAFTAQAIMNGTNATGNYLVTTKIDGTVVFSKVVALDASQMTGDIFINGSKTTNLLYDVDFTGDVLEEATVVNVVDINKGNPTIENVATTTTYGYSATTDNYSRVFKFTLTPGTLTDTSALIVDLGNADSCRLWLQNGNQTNIFFAWQLDNKWKDRYYIDRVGNVKFESGQSYDIELGRIRVTGGINAGKDIVYIKVDGNYIGNVTDYGYVQSWFYTNATSNPITKNEIGIKAAGFTISDNSLKGYTLGQADVISLNDLHNDNGYVNGSMDLLTSKGFAYTGNSAYGSVVFKTVVNFNADNFNDGNKHGTQIRFLNDGNWENEGCFWIHPTAGIILFDHSTNYKAQGYKIPTGKDVALELGRVAVMDGETFTGRFYFYAKVDGVTVAAYLTPVGTVTEAMYSGDYIWFTGKQDHGTNVMKNVEIKKTVTLKVGENSVDVDVLQSGLLVVPTFETTVLPLNKKVTKWTIEGTDTEWNLATNRVFNNVTLVATVEDYNWQVQFGDDAAQTVDNGAVIVAPANPTKQKDDTYHYVFVGWEDAEKNLFVEGTVATKDVVYTAKFDAVEHTYGDYATVTNPTYVTAGSKEATCSCGHVDTVATYMYEGKTYLPFDLDKSTAYCWTGAKITLDATGKVTGTAFPTRGEVVVTYTDLANGKVKVVVGTTNYEGFMLPDGSLVLNRESNYARVLVFAAADTEANAAISYIKYNNTANYILEVCGQKCVIANGVATVAVTTTDVIGGEDKALAGLVGANKYIYVYKGETVVVNGFIGAYDSSTYNYAFTTTDMLEGTYTEGSKELVIDGCGKAVFDGKDYAYTYENGTFDLLADDSHVVAVATNKTVVTTVPMVNVTLDKQGQGENEIVARNTCVKYVLPTLENTATKIFVGWKLGADMVTEVTPTEAMTVVAVWSDIYHLNIVDTVKGNQVVAIGEGQKLSVVVPTYTTSINDYYFSHYEVEGEEVNLETVMDAEYDNVTLTAVWIYIPPYVGTYYGSEELYNDGLGNRGGKTVTIASDGTMTGFLEGTVTSYDPETGKLYINLTKRDTSTSNMGATWVAFDAVTKTFIAHYQLSKTTNSFTYDYLLFSQNMNTDGKANATVLTLGTEKIIFVELTAGNIVVARNNTVYGGVSVKDTLGNAITTIAELKAAISVVVKQGETIVFAGAKAADKANIGAKLDGIVALDNYFGTYTCEGKDNLVIGGTGTFVWGAKEGRYVAATGTHTLDLYVTSEGKDVEYYEITLDGATYAANKPMVAITYVTEFGTAENANVNKNIEITLPVLTDTTHVFRNWYDNADYNGTAITKLVPTADVTLTAKWLVKATLTINRDNGSEIETVEYGVGEIATIANPTKEGFKFAGWNDGAWTSGTAMTADLTITAGWETAPKYYNTYTNTYMFTATSETGAATVDKRTGTFSFDAEGVGSAKNGAYPMLTSLRCNIYSYDATTGKIIILKDQSANSTYYYQGYMDAATGVMVLNYGSLYFKNVTDVDTCNNKGVVVLVPVATAAVTESHIVKGVVRFINIASDTINMNIAVVNNEVYFNADIKDIEGTALTVANAISSDTVYIYNGAALIAHYGKNGEAYVELDGYEGTYTKDADTLVINGAGKATLGAKEGAYTIEQENVLDVIFADEHIVVTLNGANFTFVKPMVDVVLNGGTVIENETRNVNTKIEIALPEVQDTVSKVFLGWYDNAEFSGKAITTYVPTANATIYAKWAVKVAVTHVPGNGYTGDVQYIPSGDTPVLPTYYNYANGKRFYGWALTENATTAVVVASVTADTTYYGVWVEEAAYVGTYKGGNTYATTTGSSFTTTMTFRADGTVVYGTKEIGSVTSYDATTGFIMVGTYAFLFGGENVMITLNGSSGETTKMDKTNDLYVYTRVFDGATTSIVSHLGFYYDNGAIGAAKPYTRLFEYYTPNGNKIALYENNAITEVVNVYDLAGTAMDIAAARASKTIIVKEGETARFELYSTSAMSSNSSTNLKVIEAVRGTFTGTNGDLVIDGIGGFTLDGVAGTYVVVEGTHQLTVKTNSDVTAYYEVTITGTTYTLVQPMVTVSYNSVVTKASEQVNKNTKFAPANMENTDELIFLGWYSDSEYKTKFTSVSKITADLELFAKWAEKVVLTYVVGNDYEQVTEDYYAGQTLTIKSFAMKNDLKITGWYEEATYDTLFTATTLTANKTIYAKWETAPAYEITTYGYSTSFKWKENDGTWSAGNAANNSSSSSLVITAKKAGTLTFDYYVKSESDSKWDYMGIYKGVFEAKSTSMPSGLLKNAGGSTGVSGNYSITLAAGESVSIVFVRDSSGGPSDTTCQISNIGFVVA